MSDTALRSPEFHREVADTILRVWRQRQRAFGYDVDPGDSPGHGSASTGATAANAPGILAWAPSVDGVPPKLSTVGEMTAAIARAYDALAASRARRNWPGLDAERLKRATSDAAVLESVSGDPVTASIALWVVAVGDLGGVARHVLDATRASIPGWRLFVLCPEGPLAERLRAQGTAVLTAPIGPADSLAGGLSAVRHAVRTLRPAIVHSHLAYSDFLVAGATVGLPVRLVTTEHGIAGNDLVYHGTRWKSRVMESAHAIRLRRFDALIAVSQATLTAVRSKWHPPKRLRTVVIPNGVDRPAELPKPVLGRLHVISLSRLAPEKGLLDLLEAFRLVHAKHPEARLTMAGEGPLRAQLEERAANLGLQEVAAIPGFVEPDSLLRDGDVLVQLSTWENCSYTLLDSAAYGLGVVTTDVGGNGELLGARQRGAKSPPASRRRGAGSNSRFSVIIPTLQRSPHLGPLVEQCAAHPLVGEVIIINNAQTPLYFNSPKVRILDQRLNIFVNPAWNLGAAASSSDFIAILNDDVIFDPKAFDYAHKVLSRRVFGVVGPDRSTFTYRGDHRPGFRIANTSATAFGFGVFMCMRRQDFVPIPPELRIWGGDDWLILHQQRPPASLVNVFFRTTMGTTTGLPEIQKMRVHEQTIADSLLHPLFGSRWWHRPVQRYFYLKNGIYKTTHRTHTRSDAALRARNA